MRSTTSRLLASVALGGAVLLGATGCNMIAPQATTIPYSAAEGVNIPASGPVAVRNALLVVSEDGTSANFLAALVNDTDDDATITIGVDGKTQKVRVDARSTVSLGFNGEKPLLFTGVSADAGTSVLASFQSGEGTGVEQSIPALDGTLDYLADFVPAD